MSQGSIASVLEMVQKMLKNKEPSEKILAFMDSACPAFYADALVSDIKTCKACKLHACNHTPFVGNINSPIVLVGEAPGSEEEKTGEPFVGPAGELLNKMLAAAATKINPRWARENLYITNTVKCRPFDGKSNRQPDVKEIATCKSFLDKELAIVKPQMIICVGAVAANTLIHPNFKMTEEHGKVFGDQVKLVAIYHPAYLLRKEGEELSRLKAEIWQDLITINGYIK